MLSGCTGLVRFVVVNESNNEITIEYSLKKEGLPPYKSIYNPEVLILDGSKSWSENDWKPLPKERFSYNDGKFTVTISPKQAVTIEIDDDHKIYDQGWKGFVTKDLKITEQGKEVYFQNNENLFNEFQINDYRINYK